MRTDEHSQVEVEGNKGTSWSVIIKELWSPNKQPFTHVRGLCQAVVNKEMVVESGAGTRGQERSPPTQY